MSNSIEIKRDWIERDKNVIKWTAREKNKNEIAKRKRDRNRHCTIILKNLFGLRNKSVSSNSSGALWVIGKRSQDQQPYLKKIANKVSCIKERGIWQL